MMQPSGNDHLTQLARQARKLALVARQRAAALATGTHRSLFLGRGLEVEDVRPYATGDDVRAIDWLVSARLHAPHVKQFVVEKDRTVQLVVDVSASMIAGLDASNRTAAAQIAAFVGFVAAHAQDRIGLILVGGPRLRVVAAGKGRRHLMRILAEVLAPQPRGEGAASVVRSPARAELADLAAGLRVARATAPRRTILLVLSDFIEPALAPGGMQTSWEAPLRACAQRHEVLAGVMVGPLERAWPSGGLCYAHDVETGQLALVDGRAQAALAQQRMAWAAQRDGALQRARAAAVTLFTDADYLAAFQAFLHARSTRHRARGGMR